MADDGWGEARPAEYIDSQAAEKIPEQPNPQATQEIPEQPYPKLDNQEEVGYYYVPEMLELLPPIPSPAKMGAGIGKQTGTVKTWINDKGFGFISRHDGPDVFVHHTAVYAQGRASLEVGESVEFNLVTSDDGRSKAADVTGPGGLHVKGSSTSYGGGTSSAGGIACRNFQSSGQCRFGANCRFVHGNVGSSGGNAPYSYGASSNAYESQNSRGPAASYSGVGGSYRGGGNGFGGGLKKPCFNFQNNGHCKFEERCRFGHVE